MSETALPRRPISVALLQFLIALAILMFVPATVFLIYDGAPRGLSRHPIAYTLLALEWLTELTLAAFAFWALWRREPYARTLGLACIALLAVSITSGFFDNPRAPADGAFPWGKATALAVLVAWAYAYGFSRKALAFFAAAAAPQEQDVAVPLQVLLIVQLALAVSSLLYTTAAMSAAELNTAAGAWVVELLGCIAVLAVMAFAVWGLWRRRPYGRWLGLVALALMIAELLYGYVINPHLRPRDLDPWARLGSLLVLGWWFYALGLSREARALFSRTTA